MDPLQQLAPPIAPPPVGAWPPAPGWWILLLMLPLLGLLLWLLRRWFARRRPNDLAEATVDPLRQAALLELQQMSRPADGEPASLWLQQLNALLKRLCRTRYPEEHPHRLSGRAWLAFLDSRCPAAGLTRWMILVEGAYRPDCRLDDQAIEGLEQSVGVWIRKHA
ncbi:DUF4381 domain-containing protein [Stutzerimonas tarimensis]|uniref:DUF4381 domain-containing protein n=1 Tax=Stutzerimonas tarimensis TaxID=1507735 RepID=A0ABV7T680_9GAMM